MVQQKFHYFYEEPEGWANVSPFLLLRKAPTSECTDGRLLRLHLPISIQDIFSSMASISGYLDSALQPQLALGVS